MEKNWLDFIDLNKKHGNISWKDIYNACILAGASEQEATDTANAEYDSLYDNSH
jgi:hypothetical protein